MSEIRKDDELKKKKKKKLRKNSVKFSNRNLRPMGKEKNRKLKKIRHANQNLNSRNGQVGVLQLESSPDIIRTFLFRFKNNFFRSDFKYT